MKKEISEETNMKISVIVPVYNVEQHLKECLDSIVTQTLTDIEIICINDGSLDNSLSILNNYARKDRRFVVISQENQGVAAARNLALQKSNGKYVIFIDPDDKYPHNNVLKTLFEKAETSKSLIVGGEFARILTNGSINKQYSTEFAGYVFSTSGIINYEDWQFDYGFQRFIFDRKFLIDNNLFFPNFRRYQDPPFLVKTLHKAKSFYAMTETVYLYRENYKTIDWTADDFKKTIDFINGCYDELLYAYNNSLYILQELLINRLFGNSNRFKKLILPHCDNENVSKAALSLCDLIKKINPDVFLEHIHGTKLHKQEEAQSTITNVNYVSSSPKVSVIVPIYNVEQYLEECLDSLINQTLKEIEIICVNDCSPDRSAEIMEKYAKNDSRIKTIHLAENGGLSNARNIALQNITGEYIFFIDSDDKLEVNALEYLYNVAKENNADQIHFLFNVLSEGKYEKITNFYKTVYPDVLTNRVFTGTYLAKRLLESNCLYVSVCSKFTKSSIIKDNNISFINGYIHEDNYFTLKLLFACNRVMAINERYYIRRLRENSIMTETISLNSSIKHVCGYAASISKLQAEVKEGLYSQEQEKILSLFCSQRVNTIVNYIKNFNEWELAQLFNFISICPGNENWKLIIHSCIYITKIKDKAYKDINLKLSDSTKKLETKIKTLSSKNSELSKKIKKTKNLEAKVNSLTYKVGLFVTFIPRKVCDIFIKIKL